MGSLDSLCIVTFTELYIYTCLSTVILRCKYTSMLVYVYNTVAHIFGLNFKKKLKYRYLSIYHNVVGYMVIES